MVLKTWGTKIYNRWLQTGNVCLFGFSYQQWWNAVTQMIMKIDFIGTKKITGGK